MVALIVILVLLALAVGAILYYVTDEGRYSRMSEEEFREEAERSTLTGAALLEVHKVFQPKRVEFLQEKDKRVEGEQAESEGTPPVEPPVPRKPS